MGIREFVESGDGRQKTITVLNRSEVDPVYRLLEKTLGDGSVTVREDETRSGTPVDAVVVEEDGSPLAVSPLSDVRNTLLMVNSDLYVTGTVGIDEVETPDVIAQLDDVTFDVERRNKLLLIHISRHIERMALETDGGVLHSSFQELSRLYRERGTLAAYRRLADASVDVHVYGLPDHDPDRLPDGLRIHNRETDEIRNSWFVVHDGDGDDDRKAALVATETGPNEYTGYWTFEPDRVDPILEYIDETYVGVGLDGPW